MKKRRWRRIKRIGTKLLIIATVFSFCTLFHHCFRLKNYGKCTVGKVVDFEVGGQSHQSSVFVYEVDGISYKNRYSGFSRDYMFNEFLVLYDTGNPARSVIYLEYPVDGEIGDSISDCVNKNIFLKVFRTGWNFSDLYLK